MTVLFTGLDTETTGLKHEKGHRIIEINMQVFRWPDRKKLVNWTQRINPEGKTMEKAAQAVHGIGPADLIGKPVFKDVAPRIELILQRSAAVVIHNAAFDLGFLAAEFAALEMDLPNVGVFDTMTEGMFASYDDKMPSLEELCWVMGVEYDRTKSHAADYDVDGMMDCFFKAVDRDLYDVTPYVGKAAA